MQKLAGGPPRPCGSFPRAPAGFADQVHPGTAAPAGCYTRRVPKRIPNFRPPTLPGANSPRPTAARRGYGGRWQRARQIFLAENPECVACGGPATVVDHIVPHRGNDVLFWDESNWQPMCKRCHDVKTPTEDGGFGNPRRGAT